MEKILNLILAFNLLAAAGCGQIVHKIAAPSESLYYEGNIYFKNKQYSTAIEKYKEFLEKNPGGLLATPAKLNLGMGYYYLADYQSAHQTFKTVNIADEKVREFLTKIIKDCETNLEKLTGPETKKEIVIKITDAYLDESGILTVKGTTDLPAKIIIDNVRTSVDKNNEFSVSISWKKGKPLIILAEDEQGNQGKLEYFPDREPPGQPEGLRAINVSSNFVELEWDSNREEDIKGYKLFYRLKGDSLQEIPESIKDNDYELMGLENLVKDGNRTFQFYLRAVDKMDNVSDQSDVIEATLP